MQDLQSIERDQLQFHRNPLTAPRRAGSIRATEVKGDEVLPHGKALEDRTISRPAGNSIVPDEDSFPSIDHNIDVTLFRQWARISLHSHSIQVTLSIHVLITGRAVSIDYGHRAALVKSLSG